MQRGVGLACIHYTWIPVIRGGPATDRLDRRQYEQHWSVNPFWEAEFTSFPDHPAARGLKPFRVRDEWYYHMRFGEGMKGVTPILEAVPPSRPASVRTARTAGTPRSVRRTGMPELVAWVYERPGGGRGFGFTGMHAHWTWAQDGFRTCVLNALVWIAARTCPTAASPPGGRPWKT